jgi:DNA-directed RNA polymerase subunit A"
MTDSDIRDVVENTDLPRRLKERVYETITDNDASPEQAQDIATAVESEYLDNRVDPLDPVGTVSAQSIGEPGTQMSIPYDEEVLIRREGKTSVVEIGSLTDSLLESHKSRSAAGHEVALAPEGLEVPSLDRDEQISWKSVEEVSRHETPDELLRFELESGRTIRATKAHSFVTRQNNEVVPVTGAELAAGDWLPVVGELPSEEGTTAIDLRASLATSGHWSTSPLTDGGIETHPASENQPQTRRTTPETEPPSLPIGHPADGTAFPEQFPLDAETGFFLGVWLATGTATDSHLTVSDPRPAVHKRIRSFANRFSLSVSTKGTNEGSSTDSDIELRDSVLAEFLRSTCLKAGEKAIPGFAFGADKAFVCGLLQGYFTSDGTVAQNSICSSPTSGRLTADVALLLSRIGVHATLSDHDTGRTLRVSERHLPQFADQVKILGARREALADVAESVDQDELDTADQIPNFGAALRAVALDADIPLSQINTAIDHQQIGRSRLARLVTEAAAAGVESVALDSLSRAVTGDVVWDRISSVETVSSEYEYVYDFSVAGLETFTTAAGVVTHNTMNTFHYAGVAEIDVTQGLPRLIELVDARKTPDTPMMTVYLADEFATDRDRAHEVVWALEATKILQLGDVSTNVADMLVSIDLNEETLEERWPTVDSLEKVSEEIAETIDSKLGVETVRPEPTVIEFGPDQPSYRELLQLVEELRDVVFKGIEEVSRVVIRKEEFDDGNEEFILYTEGSAFGKALNIEGVDASRTTCNNIHEVYRNLGVEAARESIIEETMNTLEEQGLDDVNVRHLMLVADIMTNRGEIESIGRHGISGNKESVLARAAFEVTVNHLLDAAIHGEVDSLDGVTENVIVGKPIRLGTGDVDLRMGTTDRDEAPSDD